MLGVLGRRRQFLAREYWSRQRLDDYLADSLQSLRRYVYDNSPFYQQFHRGLYDAPLEELPVLTKSMMMDHFDEVVTDRDIHLQDIRPYMADQHRDERFLGRYVINATSGSSGQMAVSIFSNSEWATLMASAFARTPLKLSFIHRIKTAQVASTTTFHMSTQGGSTFRNLFIPILMLPASEPLPSMVEKLNKWQPDTLVLYASIGRILADEQLSGRLKIAPRIVMSGSEVLTEETRRCMVQAWGDRIYNNYAATEGVAAIECEQHRGMHVMEDLAIMENVDRNNRPVPAGFYGDKLLVTVLFKYTQPLIRYEIEDSVRFTDEACPCGRPFRLIDSIQGRVQEILSLSSASSGSVYVHPLVFHNIMDTLPVSGWQVVQEVNGLHILLAGIRGVIDDKRLESLVQQALVSQGAVLPRVEVQRILSIPQTIAGKTPLVKSNLPSKPLELQKSYKEVVKK
jgi:putative adenylate-forming enzyme